MPSTPPKSPLVAICGLLLGPVLLLGTAWAADLVPQRVAVHTLSGLAIAAIGGLLAGMVAERLMHRGNSGAAQAIGLVMTTGIGVVTIGYLYLFHIRGPMATIGTLNRTVEQGLIFVHFLTAQAAGAILSFHLLPTGHEQQE